MKIYLFNTKNSSLPFLKAFCERHNHRVFNAKENDSAKGKGDD